MATISVLTVTKRSGWEELAKASLRAQTYRDFEWIVVAEDYFMYVPGASTYQAPPQIRVSNLNRSLNEGLRHCNGKLVMFYQDFIELEPNTLQKLHNDYLETGGFITTATINPDGKKDARYLGVDTLRPCIPEEWEANVALAPLDALKELGGFDESYDKGWSWDNVNLAERAALLGYKFFLDETIQPKLHFHEKEPDLNPSLIANGEYHAKVMREIQEGTRPLKVNYL